VALSAVYILCPVNEHKSSSQPEGLVMLADIASPASRGRGRDASNDRVGVSVGGEAPIFTTRTGFSDQFSADPLEKAEYILHAPNFCCNLLCRVVFLRLLCLLKLHRTELKAVEWLTTPASWSEGPGFKPRFGDRLSFLRVFVYSHSSSRQMLG
jgi:hypothetical protein